MQEIDGSKKRISYSAFFAGCRLCRHPIAIPASAEEADYIVRVTVDWNGDKYTQGNLEVYYANVRIGLYEAATGVRVRDLGSYTQKLTGYMRVTSTVTYLNPYRDLIWSRVRNLF